jgi:hypothetical protein
VDCSSIKLTHKKRKEEKPPRSSMFCRESQRTSGKVLGIARNGPLTLTDVTRTNWQESVKYNVPPIPRRKPFHCKNVSVFRGLEPCSPLERCHRFGGTCIHAALKMETASPIETLVRFYLNTRVTPQQTVISIVTAMTTSNLT